jgi:hypothetical protein
MDATASGTGDFDGQISALLVKLGQGWMLASVSPAI